MTDPRLPTSRGEQPHPPRGTRSAVGGWPIDRRKQIALLLCLALGLVGVGILADDFGQSWDDHGDARFGDASLRAYVGDPGFLQGHGDRLYYGPFFFMLSQSVVRLGRFMVPGALAADIRHGLNAFTVVLAGISLFWLAMRLTARPSAALVTVLLFCLQPVVFGHAFINQKDTPFMGLFTLSVAAGVAAVDYSRRPWPAASPSAVQSRSIPETEGAASRPRRRLRLAVVLLGIALTGDLQLRGVVYHTLANTLELAYLQAGPRWLNDLFGRVAQDAYKTPLPLYQEKVTLVYSWSSLVISLIIGALAVGLLHRVLAPQRAVALRRAAPALLAVAGAGALLGLSIATRAVGLYAGMLVLLFALFHPRRHLAIGVTVYLASAAAACYLAWPFLWTEPAANLLASIRLMLGFQPHIVLFERIHHTSTSLPRTYLPWLLTVQLTETALLLLLAGAVAGLGRLLRCRPGRDLILVLFAWAFVPIGYVVLATPSIYGNFRQFLFVLPPLFLIAGLALDLLFQWVRRWPLRVLVGALVLAPGLAGILQLYPYPYLYYNSLVGGTHEAVDRFELDYWCTSYREAMAYVNQRAPAGSLVAVHDPLPPARTFARPDLRVERAPTEESPDFALICSEPHMMDDFYPEMTTVYSVEVDGVPLAAVKQRSPSSPPGSGSP